MTEPTPDTDEPEPKKSFAERFSGEMVEEFVESLNAATLEAERAREDGTTP